MKLHANDTIIELEELVEPARVKPPPLPHIVLDELDQVALCGVRRIPGAPLTRLNVSDGICARCLELWWGGAWAWST